MNDPVRARRARISRIATIGQRLGYALFGIAAVAFFVGLATSFTDPLVLTIEVGLFAGSVVLAPSIVAAYAVKAAEREDREHGR